MTKPEYIAELRRRIAALDAQQRDIAFVPNALRSRWASYYAGSRDTLGEVIELAEQLDE